MRITPALRQSVGNLLYIDEHVVYCIIVDRAFAHNLGTLKAIQEHLTVTRYHDF